VNEFELRPAVASDSAWVAELRAEVMRPDLERLGRYDPIRVRQRFLTGFRPEVAHVITVGGEDVGLIAIRPASEGTWIEHFYLRPDQQGRGLGGQVLRWALQQPSGGRPFRLNVLQGSPARRLYERHGFVLEREDQVDAWLVRHPA